MGSRLVLHPMPSTQVTPVGFYLRDNILPINASASCIAPNLRMRFTMLLASRSLVLYGVVRCVLGQTGENETTTQFDREFASKTAYNARLL